MIIGNGDIASVLPHSEELCFFASGVSNSKETRESEFKRERDLLLEQNCLKRLVYFSTLSIFYEQSKYITHKRIMERLVKIHFPKYCIVRLGNISWGNNPYTLINNFKNHIKRKEPVEIRDVYRYIVDKDEFLHWINLIPDFNCEMNIPGRRMKVVEIFKEYV